MILVAIASPPAIEHRRVSSRQRQQQAENDKGRRRHQHEADRVQHRAAEDLVVSSQWSTRFARTYIVVQDPKRRAYYNLIDDILTSGLRPSLVNLLLG